MKFNGKIFIGPFYRVWKAVLEKCDAGKQMGKKKQELEYVQKDAVYLEYMAHKLALICAVLFWGVGFCILAELLIPDGTWIAGAAIERPAYGTGEAETELEAWIEGETEKRTVPVTIHEQKYTEDEILKLFIKTESSMPDQIKGENETLDEVRSSLKLPTSFENGAVSGEWFFEPADMFNNEGEIIGTPDEEGTLVEMWVILNCQEEEEEFHFFINVFPPKMTKEEALENKILEEVEKADENSSYEKTQKLPDTVNGKHINWKRGRESVFSLLLIVTIMAAICMGMREDDRIHKEAEKKRRELLMDYPEMVYKLTTLLRAGLTIQASFVKIANNYQEEREKKDVQKKYVYEEMLCSCYEMQSGVSEAHAYENFGQRCQIPAYIKLGSVLSQNLKKGSRGLADMLETEAISGMEEKRNMAKKLGEEAGTKLLLPMILMLMVVLAILMVPAIMAF